MTSAPTPLSYSIILYSAVFVVSMPLTVIVQMTMFGGDGVDPGGR